MLASSSRNALQGTSHKIFHNLVEVTVADAIARCRHQQRRHASTAPRSVDNILVPIRADARSRRGPYSFQRDSDFHLQRSSSQQPLARYNFQLAKRLDDRRSVEVFRLAKRMKKDAVNPDRTTYNHLLETCAHEGLYLEARAVFDDMVAMGIQPDRISFHHLLHAFCDSDQDSDSFQDVLKMMEEWSIRPNEFTHEIVIVNHAAQQRLELALQCLARVTSAGLSPTLKTASAVIGCAANLGFSRLALGLATAYERTSVRHLDGDVWVDILVSCAESLYAEGTLEAWRRVVKDHSILPDEGTCIQVLHTAARHGLSALALEVIETLKSIHIVWCEHHIAPVVEAMCRHNEVKEALMLFAFMRKNDIAMTLDTARPVLELIKKDTDAVDDAWGKLEGIHEEGQEVDIVALNVIVQATVALKDLQRAIGTYQAAPQLGLKPDIDTYNLLLSACIDARHRELGDQLLAEMKDLGIRPDATTYERMVLLCLTQSTYEDAFFYLEEMKASNMVPPLIVYESIIRKLVTVGDTRFNLALEELKECGYEVSERLQSFISSGGAHNGPTRGASSEPPVVL